MYVCLSVCVMYMYACMYVCTICLEEILQLDIDRCVCVSLCVCITFSVGLLAIGAHTRIRYMTYTFWAGCALDDPGTNSVCPLDKPSSVTQWKPSLCLEHLVMWLSMCGSKRSCAEGLCDCLPFPSSKMEALVVRFTLPYSQGFHTDLRAGQGANALNILGGLCKYGQSQSAKTCS